MSEILHERCDALSLSSLLVDEERMIPDQTLTLTTRVVQQVPGLVLYFTQQQMHKNYNNVISQHTFLALQHS